MTCRKTRGISWRACAGGGGSTGEGGEEKDSIFPSLTEKGRIKHLSLSEADNGAADTLLISKQSAETRKDQN